MQVREKKVKNKDVTIYITRPKEEYEPIFQMYYGERLQYGFRLLELGGWDTNEDVRRVNGD